MPAQNSTLQAVPLDHPVNTKVTFEKVDVSPETAERWLGRNTGNRNLRDSAVRRYTADLRNGHWLFTGETIKFDWNGVMIDGQHRLHAIIASGITAPILVVRGLDPEVRGIIDAGAKRSAGDALRFAGYTHDPMLVAAIARLALIRHWGGFQTAFAGTGLSVTNADVVAWVADNPLSVNAAQLSRSTANRIRITPSAWGYSLFEMQKLSPEHAMEFAHSTAEFRTKGLGDPRNALLAAFQLAASGRRRQPGPAECIYLAYRAWNAWVSGKSLRQIIPGRNGDDAGALIPKLLKPSRSAS